MHARSRNYIGTALIVGTVVPLVLIAIAMTMQRLMHLVPCEMCLEQRAALWIAAGLGAFGMLLRRSIAGRIMAPASAIAVGASAFIAVHQLGGERRWWVLHTPCATNLAEGGSALDRIMRTPYVRCDVPQWHAYGLTMADLNAAACTTTFIVMAWLITKGVMSERRNGKPKLPDRKED